MSFFNIEDIQITVCGQNLTFKKLSIKTTLEIMRESKKLQSTDVEEQITAFGKIVPYIYNQNTTPNLTQEDLEQLPIEEISKILTTLTNGREPDKSNN